MRSLLSYLIIVICLASCQDTISLDQIKGKNTLVVYAFPTNNDTIVIKVSASQPIQGKAEKLSITSVSCLTNGKDDKIVDVGYNDDSGTTVATYYAIGKHQCGDEIQITVNDANLATASAMTIIPASSAIGEVNSITSSGFSLLTTFRVASSEVKLTLENNFNSLKILLIEGRKSPNSKYS